MPLERFKPLPLCVTLLGDKLHDDMGRALEGHNLKKVRAGVFLQVSPELVMSKRIEPTHKERSVSDIVAELLPFEPDEVLATCDDSNSMIFSVLKSDLADDIDVLTGKGYSVLGVAFNVPTVNTNPSINGLKSYVFFQNSVQAKKNSNALILLGILALILALCSAVFAGLSQREHSHQLQVRAATTTSKEQLKGLASNDAYIFPKELLDFKNGQNNAEYTLKILRGLRDSLNTSTKVDQIILNAGELIIDAQDIDANAMQRSMDQQEMFLSTDFVSSISRSGSDALERFRIKAIINNDALLTPQVHIEKAAK